MKQIEIIDDESNVFGYITSLDETAFDYMSAFFSNEQIKNITAWLEKQKIYEFAVLRNIYVDEANRGQGFGKSLVAQFMSQTQGLPILLLASPDEENFQLQEWYQKLGFELTSFLCEDGPLMLRK